MIEINPLYVIISLAIFALGGLTMLGVLVLRVIYHNRYEEIIMAISFFRQTNDMLSNNYKIDNNLNTWLHWTKHNRFTKYYNDGWDTSVILKYQMIPIDNALCDICHHVRLCITCNTTEFLVICSKCSNKVHKFIIM